MSYINKERNIAFVAFENTLKVLYQSIDDDGHDVPAEVFRAGRTSSRIEAA